MRLVDDLMWWMAKHGSQLSIEPIEDITGKTVDFKIQLDTRYNGKLLRARNYVAATNLNSDDAMENCLANMISEVETLMEVNGETRCLK